LIGEGGNSTGEGSGGGRDVDEAVVSRVLDGDIEAFAELVKRHGARVYRVGLSWFRDHDEAEDLVQDVFIKAFTKLATFRGNSLFSTWLLRIAFNTAISRKSRRHEHEMLDPEFERDRRPGTEETHLANESASELREALASLTPDQLLCVELFFFEEMPYTEISKITGFPVNTIKSHVFRAKRALRANLSEKMEG
jgi:RNA polymerase sigma-70 factor (ECF subfamily)